jgi:hypothetical protein
VLAFFGLTPSYKSILLEEIHSLCYFGQGGFTHDDVYNMPIRYRHYHIKKIIEHVEKQNEEIANQTKSLENKPDNKPIIPDFATTVKAPKK